MSVTIRVKMNQNVQKAMKAAQGRALLLSGMEIEKAMKLTLSSPGGASHTPSAPGMPPNRQHGELRSSCATALRSDGNGVLSGATARYAHIQDQGGVTHPTVTAKMRRWAWAMLRKTGERLYKGIALTKKSHLTIVLPPRPFVQRSLDKALPNIMKHWKGMLHK